MTDSEPSALAPPGGSVFTRIAAMVVRHWYLITGSWTRLLDLAYWPTVQMLLWGFIQEFLSTQPGFFAQAFGVLLGAALLWDVFFRSQIAFSISFLEEIWSRNLGHLMVSPLRPPEFLASLITVSLMRTLVGLVPASLLAIAVFGFSIYGLGLGLVAFFFNLAIFGWTMGILVSGLVLRYGQGAESLAWALAVGFAPLSAVYYPISVLPDSVEWLAYALPPAYVFEGMRGVLIEHTFKFDLFVRASLLNLAYLTGSVFLFMGMLRAARRRGTLLQLGE